VLWLWGQTEYHRAWAHISLGGGGDGGSPPYAAVVLTASSRGARVADAVVRRLEGGGDSEGGGGGGQDGGDESGGAWGPALRHTEWLLRNPNGLCRFWSPPDPDDQWIASDRRRAADDMRRRQHEGWAPGLGGAADRGALDSLYGQTVEGGSGSSGQAGERTTAEGQAEVEREEGADGSPVSPTSPSSPSSPWYREPRVARLRDEWEWARTRLGTGGLAGRLALAAAARGAQPWRVG